MDGDQMKPTRALLNVEDYHRRAKEKLSTMAYDYYSAGSDDQLTLSDNQQAFRRMKLRPKILVDVSEHSPIDSISCKTQVLNSATTISFPCIIAPTALHRLADEEHGELATVRAAVACSTIMCVSTVASTSLESIADEHRRQIAEHFPQSHSQLWYQLYVLENRPLTRKLIERAERAGYKALVITVDTCELGNREATIHNQLLLRNGVRAENLIDEETDFTNDPLEVTHDASFSWKDLAWIRSITSLPLILKGVLHPDDAREAVKYGIQGIVVSNHGGRQLDTSVSTIDALTDIIEAVGRHSSVDVYVDSGVRRGTDILKAVALGAKAVLVGRPVLWGLAVEGEHGVRKVLEILKKEFRLAMMLCGCPTVDDVRKNNLLMTRRSKL